MHSIPDRKIHLSYLYLQLQSPPKYHLKGKTYAVYHIIYNVIKKSKLTWTNAMFGTQFFPEFKTNCEMEKKFQKYLRIRYVRETDSLLLNIVKVPQLLHRVTRPQSSCIATTVPFACHSKSTRASVGERAYTVCFRSLISKSCFR